MEITKEQVQEFLNNNSEEAKEITSSFFTPEAVKSYLDTDAGKEILQPRLDKHFSQGLNTWKSNNLQKIINEEIAKLNPSETEEQKALREANAKIAQMEAENKRKDLLAYAQTKANELGISSFLASRCIGEDEASTLELLTEASNDFSNSLSNAVKAQLENTDTTPNVGGTKKTGALTKKDFINMSYKDRMKLFQEDPELYSQLSK